MEAIQMQHDNYVIYSQWKIADAIIIAMVSYNNSELYNTLVSLDDANNLDWIYSEGFDEVIIPGMVLEAILNAIAVRMCERKLRHMQEQYESDHYVIT